MIKKVGRPRIKPDIDEGTLGINPFIGNLKIIASVVKSEDRYKLHDKNSSEPIFEYANYEFEYTPYCKVFSDSKRRLHVNKLTTRAKDLLLWLMMEIDKNKDYIWINKERYMSECGVNSMNTYRAAIGDLVEYGFITRTKEMNTYWINPNYFFNGNRLTKYPDNIIKRSINGTD
jgi:hypothetical protein